MTKADIINKIAEDTGLAKKDVAVTVEAFMEEIRHSMAVEKENVYLRGFGTFTVKHRAKKTARNISKNTPNGKKKKGHKMATHKRKKRLRKNRHKSK